MPFTKEEIINLEALLQSPVEENVKLAFAILEGKEYSASIKNFLEECKILYDVIWAADNPKILLEQIVLLVNRLCESGESKGLRIKLHTASQNIGLFKNIKFLYLEVYNSPLSWISKLTELDTLVLRHNRLLIQELSVFKNLKKLKKLNLLDCEINQVKLNIMVTELSNLESLYLSKNMLTVEMDFSVLSSLKSLKELSITDIPLNQESLNTLTTTLINLEELWISDIASANIDFSVLSSFLKKLKKLTLSRCYLEKLPLTLSNELEMLNVSFNPFTKANFSVLKSLKKLKILNLQCCDLKKHMFLEISTLTQLEELDICLYRRQSYFPMLIPLKNLKKLTLYCSNLKHLPKGIEELLYLEELNLDGNPLSEADFSALLDLKNLKKLSLWECNISQLSPTLIALQNKGIEIIYSF